MYILVAEDNEFSREFMLELLAGRGHAVRIAANGREALALAAEEVFDVLLLDVHMPELDGFEVAARIRRLEQASGGRLPIVALTARSRREDRDRCLAAGMDDFLTKPVGPEELFATIDGVLSGTSGSAGVDGLLDPIAVLGACEENAETLAVMIGAFQVHLPARMAALREALRAEHRLDVAEAAREIRVALGAFSTTAGDMASGVEHLATQGRVQEALPAVEQLEAVAERLLRLTGSLSIEKLRRQASPR